MSKTFKDRPSKYAEKLKYRKTKDKPFASSKGRQKENIKKNLDKYEL